MVDDVPNSPQNHLQDFAERVRALIAPFGSIAKAAKALEIPENTLRRACAGRNEPQAPLLIALSQKLNVSMSYLLGLSDDPVVSAPPGLTPSPRLEFARIPSLDVEAAAGGGVETSAVAIENMLAFPQWMLRKLAPPGAKLAFMRAQGDSMSPLFNDGALLLVNESDARLKQDAGARPNIYVFQQDGALRVKRLRLKPNGDVIVASDNPDYDPEFHRATEAKRLKLLGRVIWWDDRL
jgi:phage repressor protein C with HTH and peptisase S24 domain